MKDVWPNVRGRMQKVTFRFNKTSIFYFFFHRLVVESFDVEHIECCAQRNAPQANFVFVQQQLPFPLKDAFRIRIVSKLAYCKLHEEWNYSPLFRCSVSFRFDSIFFSRTLQLTSISQMNKFNRSRIRRRWWSSLSGVLFIFFENAHSEHMMRRLCTIFNFISITSFRMIFRLR